MKQYLLLIRLVRMLRKSSIYAFLMNMKFFVLHTFVSKAITIDYKDARKFLNEQWPRPESTSIKNNIIDKEFKYDLTVIVPCYNVESYLSECINSILNQTTTYRYKTVLIDDGSTDGTGRIIDSYAKEQSVTIVHQENKGLSGARNRGLSHIESEYVMFIDSDDYLMPGAIQNLLDAAKTESADIVEGSHYRLYDKKLVKAVKHKNMASNDNNLSLVGMAWGKIYRSTLFEKIVFPEKLYFEDTICSFLLYPMASRIVTISDYVYVYRIISGSISHSSAKNVRSIDTIWVTELMMKEHEIVGVAQGPSYSSTVVKQIVLNYNRLKKLPEEIQQAAFVVMCEDLKIYCQALQFEKKDRYLIDSLNAMDFGKYKLFCQTRYY